MKELRILAVDDDRPKLNQLVQMLEKSLGLPKHEIDGVNSIKFKPERFLVSDGVSIDQVVDAVLNADCAVIDYQLGSDAIVPFTGVDVLNEVLERHKNFPAFVLTSHQEDVFCKEIIDVCHVFAFDRYLNSETYAEEINNTISRQVCNHERELREWERQLLALRDKKHRTAEDDERILELDTWIEQCVSPDAKVVSRRAKRDLTSTRIDELISKIDELISSCGRR